MILNIRATNNSGDVFVFDNDSRIVNGLDLSGLEAKVNRTETNIGGSRYQNTILDERQFDLEIQLRRLFNDETQMDARRAEMYKVFTPEQNPIRFDFQTSNGDQYYLTAYALNAPVMKPDKRNNHAAFQKALLQFVCTDPYIYQSVESRLELATYVGGLEFDWEIPDDGDMFEERTQGFEASVYFPGTGIDGMNIVIRAFGTVVNPTLTNANTFERIRLNTTMVNGDVINVSTYRGERNITLTRNNVTTPLFYTFDLASSTFLQLRPGDNSFVYGADSGEDSLEMIIEYRIRKVGV